MFRPPALFIGLRYTRAKKRNHFISFISLMSMLGIALGVLVLITVLSVMNGFDHEIKKRVFSMVPAVTASSVVGYINHWNEVENMVRNVPDVTAVAPFVSGQVLLTNNSIVQPALVNGIVPLQEKNISALYTKIVQGDLNSLTPGSYHVVLGQDLADRLGVTLGDKIVVVTPQVSVSVAGVIPRFKRFIVSGIFKAGSGFGFDGSLAFVNLKDAQTLLELGSAITGLHINIKDVYAVDSFTQKLALHLNDSARVTNWTEQFGEFFHAVSLEKKMMFFILLLIIAVAVFNLVSTLVMVVNEKESDIAILRTYGATPQMIMRIFMVQGTIIGVVGTLLGVLGGVLLALNVTGIVSGIEHIFHVKFLSSNVYFVNYLPSELQWKDVFKIASCALVLSFIATLYPAWRASKTVPVEALRYE